uniref:Uncharacterized protein n=1 Tax=Aegilops tauschii TaxID=37682 RepID=M8C9C2_AEGTA
MCAPGWWRLSAGGEPFPLLHGVEHPSYFSAEIERVQAPLSEEELALPEYEAGNHESWARTSIVGKQSGSPPSTTRRW